jgi:hypothetical protein
MTMLSELKIRELLADAENGYARVKRELAADLLADTDGLGLTDLGISAVLEAYAADVLMLRVVLDEPMSDYASTLPDGFTAPQNAMRDNLSKLHTLKHANDEPASLLHPQEDQ